MKRTVSMKIAVEKIERDATLCWWENIQDIQRSWYLVVSYTTTTTTAFAATAAPLAASPRSFRRHHVSRPCRKRCVFKASRFRGMSYTHSFVFPVCTERQCEVRGLQCSRCEGVGGGGDCVYAGMAVAGSLVHICLYAVFSLHPVFRIVLFLQHDSF